MTPQSSRTIPFSNFVSRLTNVRNQQRSDSSIRAQARALVGCIHKPSTLTELRTHHARSCRDPAEKGKQAGGDLFGVEMRFCPSAAVLAHRVTQIGVGDECFECLAQAAAVVRRNEKTTSVMLDDL